MSCSFSGRGKTPVSMGRQSPPSGITSKQVIQTRIFQGSIFLSSMLHLKHILYFLVAKLTRTNCSSRPYPIGPQCLVTKYQRGQRQRIFLPLPKKQKTKFFLASQKNASFDHWNISEKKRAYFDTLLEVLYLFVMMRQLPLELQDDLLCVLALPNVCACMQCVCACVCLCVGVCGGECVRACVRVCTHIFVNI